MICSRCHRKLTKPAVTSGTLTLGPVCSRLMGLGPVPRVIGGRLQGEGRHRAPMPGQLALFEVVPT